MEHKIDMTLFNKFFNIFKNKYTLNYKDIDDYRQDCYLYVLQRSQYNKYNNNYMYFYIKDYFFHTFNKMNKNNNIELVSYDTTYKYNNSNKEYNIYELSKNNKTIEDCCHNTEKRLNDVEDVVLLYQYIDTNILKNESKNNERNEILILFIEEKMDIKDIAKKLDIKIPKIKSILLKYYEYLQIIKNT